MGIRQKTTEPQWLSKSVLLFLAMINDSLGECKWSVIFDVARNGSEMQNRFFKTGHFGKRTLKPIFLLLLCMWLVVYEQAIATHES